MSGRSDDPKIRKLLGDAIGVVNDDMRRRLNPTVGDALEDLDAAQAAQDARGAAFAAEQQRLVAAAEAGRQEARAAAPVQAQAPMGNSTVGRRDVLTAVIEASQQAVRARGGDPRDTAVLWAELEDRASRAEAPLMSVNSGGIRYRDGAVRVFTKRALRERLKRQGQGTRGHARAR